MATYKAITTINYLQNGYEVVAEDANKAECERKANEAISNEPANIYRDTRTTNLRIVPETTYKKLLAKHRQDVFATYGHY